jgi:hypothetical protein
VNLDLPGGIGVSLVSSNPAEEILFAHLTGINVELVSTGSRQKLDVVVKNIQCDNQLFGAECPVAVHVTAPSPRSEDGERQQNVPALKIAAERVPNLNSNVETFKVFHM